MTDPKQFLIYQSEDGHTRIDVMLDAETLWMNQKQLTELFGKAKGAISEHIKHIKHIFEDGELTPAATVRLFRTVQSYNFVCFAGYFFAGFLPDVTTSHSTRLSKNDS